MRPVPIVKLRERRANSLVGAVNVVDSKNSQVTVVTEVTQGDARASLELLLIDNLLASVEGNGHGEHIAISKAVVLTDTMHIVSCRCYRLFAQNEGFLIPMGSSVSCIPVVVCLVHETCMKISPLPSMPVPLPKNKEHGSQWISKEPIALTLQRRETSVHDQFEITQLALSEGHSGERLGLSGELGLAGSIAGEKVLEDTTVRGVGHSEYKKERIE